MMTIRVEIVSAQAKIYSGTAELVVVPAILGEMGIAPRHAPLLTKLKPGCIRIVVSPQHEEVFYTEGGLAEVQPHVVTVLADVVMRAENLDEAAALAVKKRVEKTLLGPQTDLNYSQALAELAQAIAQIRTIERFREKPNVKSIYEKHVKKETDATRKKS
jgi:F-type H+-transporting ATPase subunit epsilon